MTQLISIAIETSCRHGGVALGIGERLADAIDFDAGARHATHLVVRLRELLGRHGLRAADVNEAYVSAGPGSFTGVRVGITVARTLAQAVAGLRCVSVPSVLAVAENAAALPWQHLGVILDAKDELVYAQLFGRATTPQPLPVPVPAGEPAVMPFAEFLAAAPKPLLLTGEGLLYQKIVPAAGKGDRHRFQTTKSVSVPFSAVPFSEVTLADPSIYYPTAQGVWTVGRRLARSGDGGFTEYHHLLPIYARRSEAERLWDLRHGNKGPST